MRRHRPHQSSWQILADLNMLVMGVLLLITSMLILSISVKAVNKDGEKPKAEFLVTLTWETKRDVDLDLWLQQDEECIVYYHARECPNISLDRDSLGFASNLKVLPNGNIALSPNQEVMAIRAIMPGDYVVGVSYFSGRDEETGRGYIPGIDNKAAIDCDVELIKINPTYTTITKVTLHFIKVKQTHNAVAFHVNEDGSVEVMPLPTEDMISKHQKVHPGPL